MSSPNKQPQKITVIPDGKVNFPSKQWFHGDEKSVKKPHYYAPRPHSEVDPLVCGAETLPAVLNALEAARESIEITLWCFDPALCMRGYDPDLQYKWELFASLRDDAFSPRVGDVLLRAADRGVKIRMLVWTFGELMTNPLKWEPLLEAIPDIVTENEDKLWDAARDRTSLTQKAILTLGLSAAKKQGLLAFLNKRIPFFTDPPDRNSRGYFIKKRLISSDWVYRKLWYQKIQKHTNIEYRTIGPVFSSDLVTGFLADLTVNSDALRLPGTSAGDDFLLQTVLKHFPSHHQKSILVDYESSNYAVGFVMGNNLRTVDYDEMKHPAKPPERRGRYPDGVPRQDIATRIRGRALHDVNANFCRVWADAGGSLSRPQPPEFLSTMKKFLSEETVQRYNGEAQVSCTILGSQQPGFIHDAYMQAVTACTQYVYLENQYFRYAPFAAKLKEYANKRYTESEQEQQKPIYYFVVVNNPENIATSTTYEMLEKLGHEGQMSGEKFRRLQQDLERKRQQLRNLKRNLEILQSGAGDLSLDYAAKVKFMIEEIAKLEQEIKDLESQLEKTSKPKEAKKYPEANDAFRIEDSDGLKGHIATMLVSYEAYVTVPGSRFGAATTQKAFYIPVNIHTKTMIVDDVFTIIGSANMHKRGMQSDNEIDVATTKPGVADSLRRKLFENLLYEKSEQMPWQRIYKIWKERLDDNWRKRYLNQELKGFLFYLYEPKDQSNIPDVD